MFINRSFSKVVKSTSILAVSGLLLSTSLVSSTWAVNDEETQTSAPIQRMVPFAAEDFLGTMAGKQARSFSRIKNEETYSRLFEPFVDNSLRENIAKTPFGKNFKAIGDDYSYTPPRLRDGRAFSYQPGRMQGGGFFLTLKELQQDEAHSTSSAYVLNVLQQKLEAIAGLSIQELQAQNRAYGINYLINRYFDCVTHPEEEDIAVYPSASAPHVGIYRESQPNWNSPYGGTIESKWGMCSSFVFQHDVFFVPTYYENVVQFYRLKKQPVSFETLPQEPVISSPLWTLRDDFYYQFNKTDENIKIRKQISQLNGHELVTQIPAIRIVHDINFIGLCYDYAFGAIFKTYSPPKFMPALPNNAWIEQYFTVTTNPKKGDLACYYRDPVEQQPIHYGIYIGSDLIESKWGSDRIHQHPSFYVGPSYEDYMRYYSLNPEYLTNSEAVSFLQMISSGSVLP